MPLPTRRDTVRFGRALAGILAPSDLVVLEGPLGSGKTFLVRAVCRRLGLGAEKRVTSPTFSLVHEYETVPPVVHADLYRLESDREVRALGLLEQREAGKVLLVEWGARHLRELGDDALLVTFEVSPRVVTVRGTGPISADRALALL